MWHICLSQRSSRNLRNLPHSGRIPAFMLKLSRRQSRRGFACSINLRENYIVENRNRSRCNAYHADCRRRCGSSAPTARLSRGSGRQDADRQKPNRQVPHWEEPGRQVAHRGAVLIQLSPI
jgi:hypothetical protein